jgi:hypothetical protein
MEPIDHFLREHAYVHSKAVAPMDINMDWLVEDLTDDQWRARPHGLNSVAWTFYHVARVEDGCLAPVVLDQPQLLDDAWRARLGVDRRDDGGGKAEVGPLSQAIDIAALREYRDAVGRRTREVVRTIWPDRWKEPLGSADVLRGVAAGTFDSDAEFLHGKPRESLLTWWGVNHTIWHFGQLAMLRGLLR